MNITRTQVIEACKALGFDATDLAQLTITSRQVTAITFDRNAEGHRFLGPDPMHDGYVKTGHVITIDDQEETA